MDEMISGVIKVRKVPAWSIVPLWARLPWLDCLLPGACSALGRALEGSGTLDDALRGHSTLQHGAKVRIDPALTSLELKSVEAVNYYRTLKLDLVRGHFFFVSGEYELVSGIMYHALLSEAVE